LSESAAESRLVRARQAFRELWRQGRSSLEPGSARQVFKDPA
jgi:hypothetical protein